MAARDLALAAWQELQVGHLRWAILMSAAATIRDPSLADAYRVLGLAHRARGRWDRAERAFERGLAAAPGDVPLLIELGHLAHDRGRYVEAERIYTQAVARRPGDPMLHLQVARALDGQERREEAAATLERVRAAGTREVRVLQALGDLRLELEQHAEAVGPLREAQALGADDAHLHHELAYAYAQLGRWEEMEAEARRALEFEPTNAEYQKLLAFARERLADRSVGG